MLTANEREELEQLGAASVRAKLLSHAGGRRSVLDGFVQSGDPLRGDVEDWLGEQAKVEATAQQKLLRSTARWARIAALTGIAGIILIGWIAWRPDSYIAVMDRLAAPIIEASGGLWRH